MEHNTPDGSTTRPEYLQSGRLNRVTTRIRSATAFTELVHSITYNAKGQRTQCEYANPTATGTPVATTLRTTYAYDPLTFRLTGLVTNRLASGAVSAAKLQDLHYVYDPVGNIVAMVDQADTGPIFSGAAPVSGNGDYTYDALYRLSKAEGREHPGQGGVSTQPRGDYEIPKAAIPHANDLQALVRYVEDYSYDDVGNIQKVKHTTTAPSGGPGPSATQWTRNYQYGTDSNRLLASSEPGDASGSYSATYTYNENGSMTHMPHLPVIDWDHAEHMRHANKGGGGEVYFTYDGSGQRVRKVWEHAGLVEERIYLGGYEIYRRRSGGTLTLERQTLHVTDDKRRVAMVETKTVDTAGGGATPSRWRIQLENHLGSSTLEVSETGRVISYEEYHPYGTTAFHSSDGSTELSAKRYRYTGKEKDEETGLYYHGARYYTPWLGRWTAADPLDKAPKKTRTPRTRVWSNTYTYCLNNPLAYTDPSGQAPQTVYHFTTVEAAQGVLKEGFKPGQSGFTFFTEKASPVKAGSEAAGAPVRLGVQLSTEGAVEISYGQWHKWYQEAKAALEAKGELKGADLESAAQAIRNQKAAEFMRAAGKDLYRIKVGGQSFIAARGSALAGARITEIFGAGASKVVLGEGIASQVLSGRAKEAAEAAERAGLSQAAAGRFGKAASVVKWVGRPLVAVAVAADLYEIHQAHYSTRTITSVVTGWGAAWALGKAGAWGGARIGGAIAAVAGQAGPQVATPEEVVTVPVFGAIGGVVGGIGGGVIGYFGGRKVATTVYDWTFE